MKALTSAPELPQPRREVECRAFQRQVRYLTALPLVANPPRRCFEKQGQNCSGKWEVVLDECNLEYGALVQDVSEETFNADRRDGSSWCGQWGSLMPAPNATVVSLRSASDPYIAAAVITNCQFNFGPTRAQYAQLGVNVMAAGAALTAALCCCLACLVYARPDGSSYGDSVPGYQGIGYGAPRGGWAGSACTAHERPPVHVVLTIPDTSRAVPLLPPRLPAGDRQAYGSYYSAYYQPGTSWNGGSYGRNGYAYSSA